MVFETIIILIFILINGLFASSEIAVVTSRKTTIETLSKEGNKNAKILLDLKRNPDRFLATVQIGVTITAALASAIGGAAASETLKPIIELIPIKHISLYSEAIAIGVVVLAISYVSLILGELVPKSIALRSPDKIALFMAKPIYLFSKTASFFVTILTASTNLILKPFGQETFTERAFVTEEEIKLLVKEGRNRGIFEPDEQELIHSVFEFTDLSVKEVIVPVGQVDAISLDMPLESVLQKISEEQYSRYPVYNNDINNIKGVLYAKDVFKLLVSNKDINIRKLLRSPFFVPETMKISNLLKQMQKKHMHMAVAINEYGAVAGIVTIEDLIEEIVGEIRDEFDVETPVITIGANTYIIDGAINIRDLKEDYGIEIPESDQYDSLGGFIVTTLQKIPSGGEIIELDHLKATVLEMVHTRISKVKVEIITSKKEKPSQTVEQKSA
ncbi:membrane protein containing DUF21 [Candidatus Magnetoovum chiemensis]|nr:membrane protein containing DUF21 [Candidatus Magnetoovum chiemensis]